MTNLFSSFAPVPGLTPSWRACRRGLSDGGMSILSIPPAESLTWGVSLLRRVSGQGFFSLRWLFLLLLSWVAFVGGVSEARAQPSSGSVSFSLNTSTTNTAGGTLLFNYVWNGTNGWNVTLVSGPSTNWVGGVSIALTASGSGGNNFTTYPQTLNTTGDIQFGIRHSGVFYAPESTTLPGSGPGSNSIDFYLHANLDLYPIVYRFYQSGAEIGSVTQGPGAGAQTVHLGGLATADPVTCIASVTIITIDADGVPHEQAEGQSTQVGSGVPSTSGTSVTTSGGLVSGGVVGSTNVNPDPLIPAVVTAPTPTTPPTPHADGAAVTAPSGASADASAAADFANGIITAVNQSKKATEDVVAAVHAAGNANTASQTAAANGVIAAIALSTDSINGTAKALADAALKAGQANGNGPLLAAVNGDPVAAITTHDPSEYSPVFNPDLAKAAAVGSYLPVAPSVENAVEGVHTVGIHFALPAIVGTPIAIDYELDFTSPAYATAIGIFRAVNLGVLILMFYLGTVRTIRSSVAG